MSTPQSLLLLACLSIACSSSSPSGVDSASAGHAGNVDHGGSSSSGGPASDPDDDDQGGSSASGGTSGGSGGSQATAAEALIQDVALEKFPREAEVMLKGVFVTAKSGVGFSSDFWVQEPVGVAPADQPYPRHAGLQVYPDPKTGDLRLAVQNVKVGDCVDLTGTVGRVGGYPEIDGISALATRDPGSCGTAPEPLLIDDDTAFAGIISDADPNESDSQPAADSVAYNGLLLRVTSLTVQAKGVTAEYRVARTGAEDGKTAYLVVFPPFSGAAPAVTEGQTFKEITGIYTNGVRLSPSFGIAPRSADDLVP